MGFIFCHKDTNNPPNRKKNEKKKIFSLPFPTTKRRLFCLGDIRRGANAKFIGEMLKNS